VQRARISISSVEDTQQNSFTFFKAKRCSLPNKAKVKIDLFLSTLDGRRKEPKLPRGRPTDDTLLMFLAADRKKNERNGACCRCMAGTYCDRGQSLTGLLFTDVIVYCALLTEEETGGRKQGEQGREKRS
jgi:hypothetical protein